MGSSGTGTGGTASMVVPCAGMHIREGALVQLIAKPGYLLTANSSHFWW